MACRDVPMYVLFFLLGVVDLIVGAGQIVFGIDLVIGVIQIYLGVQLISGGAADPQALPLSQLFG